MNKRIMLLTLSVLMVFTMACAMISNILGNVESEVSDLVMDEVSSIAEELEDAVEEQSSMTESEDDPVDESESNTMESEETAATEEAVVAEDQSENDQPVSTGGVITSGPCYNPYFPVIEDRVMVYQNRMEEAVGWESTHEFSFENVSNESFTQVFRYEEMDTEGNPVTGDLVEIGITWACTEEGLLQQEFNFFSIEPLDGTVDIEYDTVSFDGVSFPSEADFTVGSSWEADYSILMETTVEGITVSSEVEIHQVSTAVGFEPVSVAYGDFDEALRVDTQREMVMTAQTEDGTAFTIDTLSTESTWYVKDIGMVKQTSSQDNQATSYLQELAEIK